MCIRDRIWVPQNPEAWAGPKLIFPDIAEKPTFCMDLGGAVVNGDSSDQGRHSFEQFSNRKKGVCRWISSRQILEIIEKMNTEAF